MKNMKVSINLLLPHIVILLLLVAGIIISLVSLLNIGKQAETLYNESYVVKNAANTIDAVFERMQKSVFYSISNFSEDIVSRESENVKDCAVIIEKQIAIIKQKFLGDRDIVSRLEKNSSELKSMQDQVLNLIDQNKNEEAIEYMDNNNIPVINEAKKELVLLIQMADAKENETITSLQETRRIITVFLIPLGIVSVLFSIRVGTYIRLLQK